MKCPKCGNELEEGKLLCEKCGEEIKIVPDFDIELETKLSESINSMLEEITEKEQDNNNKEIYIEEDDIKYEFRDYFPAKTITFDKKNKKVIIIVVSLVFIMLSIISIMVINHINKNSYSYQYNKAIEYASEDNYSKAIIYLERALAINSEDLNASVLLAKYYNKSNQTQSAISVLKEVLEASKDVRCRDEAYDLLLIILEEQQNYIEMGQILKECNIPRIVSKYNKYAVLEPVFNKQGGVYDEIISITLNGNTQGIVYYTLDGSSPTKNSMVYETPILLETGEYIIKAMFVNMYGAESNIVTQSFYISLSSPEEPVINYDSGVYAEPLLIEAFHDYGTKIYYTMDGSVPDKNSTRYTTPLEMPYGISNFSFVAINDKGLSSDVVNRTYQLNIQANFTTELALQVLMNTLWAEGKLKDLDGHVPNKLGVNQYSVKTIADIEDTIYYIVNEEYIDTTGKIHNTNNIYAIDVTTAELYKAYKYDEGKYNLQPL